MGSIIFHKGMVSDFRRIHGVVRLKPDARTSSSSCCRRSSLTRRPIPQFARSSTAEVAHWRLGLVLEKEGKKGDRIAEIDQAVRLRPDLDDAKKDLKRLR